MSDAMALAAPEKAEVRVVFADVQHSARCRGVGEMLAIVGNCLDPWLSEGDCIWYDSEIEPQDRDLIIVEMRYRRRSTVQALGPGTFTMSPCDGPAVIRRPALKQFRIYRGRAWLACADGWAEMGEDVPLLGVVTAWHRPGADRAPMAGMDFEAFRGPG